MTSTPTVDVGPVAAKVMTEEDDAGDVWYAVRAMVRNKTNRPVRVTLQTQGIDADGFEVTDLQLSSIIQPTEERSVTNRYFLAATAYDTIVRWQIQSISVDDPD